MILIVTDGANGSRIKKLLFALPAAIRALHVRNFLIISRALGAPENLTNSKVVITFSSEIGRKE
jgi:hypothetical protein